MIHKMPCPKLGWTMEKGKIISWMKKEGSEVTKGEEILELETDKVTLKVEAPETGILVRLLVKEGESVPVNHTIALIAPRDAVPPDAELDALVKQTRDDEAKSPAAVPVASAATRQPQARPPAGSGPHGTVLASPKARRLASERGIDLRRVRGTGPDGAITASDIETCNLTGGMPGIERVARDARLAVAKEVHVEGIRQVIASRMFSSLQTAAQLTITTEVNMDASSAFRNVLNARRAKGSSSSISYNDLIVLVVSDVLKRHEKFNSSFDGNVITYIRDINIGVATATDRGLMVPVVWHADSLSLDEINERVKGLAKAARNNSIKPDDLSGSTFTVTNLGMFGIDAFTPVINPPEMAILGIGRIVTKPGFSGGMVKPVQSMVLSLTFDHQIIDGHEAALFLQDVTSMLESYQKLETLHDVRASRASVQQFKAAEQGGNVDFDVVVLGDGPAGNECAVSLATKGLKVAVIEHGNLGGTCLNKGCVPLKNLFSIADLVRKARLRNENDSGVGNPDLEVNLAAATSKKNAIIQNMRDAMARQYKDLGITLIEGTASFKNGQELSVTSKTGNDRAVSFSKAVIATGASYVPVFDASGATIPDTDALFELASVPASICILGSGKVPLELASILAELGAGAVHVISPKGFTLPMFDPEINDAIIESLELQSVELHGPAAINSIVGRPQGRHDVTITAPSGKQDTITVDVIINAGERGSNSKGLHLDSAGIKCTDDGAIKVDEMLRTSNARVYAMGDAINVHAKSPYTYLAAAQGRAVANAILGLKMFIPGENSIPVGLFSLPPAVSIGYTATECTSKQIRHDVVYYPFSRLVAAHLVHELNGLVKIIVNKDTQVVLGMQAFCEMAHELVSVASVAIVKQATLPELLDALYLHPSFSEAFRDASFSWVLKPK